MDVLRQALAEKGRLMQKVVTAAFRAGDKQVFELSLIHISLSFQEISEKRIFYIVHVISRSAFAEIQITETLEPA